MRIGIVSDTHGHWEYTLRALERLKAFDVDQVIHCGDIGSVEIVPLFDEWPTHFVFGNVDRSPVELTHAIKDRGQQCHGYFGRLEADGAKVGFLHGHQRFEFEEAVGSGEYDIVCYGHTHVAESHTVKETLVLNPGALFRANPHSFAVVTLPSLKVEQVDLN